MKTYSVKLNGKELELNKVTVSAMPFNRVFRGKQRSLDQTEEAYFVTADIQDSAVLEISTAEGFDDYEIRPLAFDLSDKRVGNTVTLKVDRPMQFTFEPDGFHNALHVFINPPCQKPYGDVIYYGKGVHTAGLIWLESGQTLYLEEGARVYGVIYAKDARDIKIMGRGIIDSSPYRRGDDLAEDGREIYNDLIKHGIETEPAESRFVCSNMVLHNCKNVYVEGITLQDSMFWSLIVRNHCENVVIDNIKIVGQWRYNSDGIDICASKNVTVKNSFVRSFDDCFVARAPFLLGETEDVENVVVKNCVFWCDWGKSLEIWCGDKPCTIKNITLEDIYLIRLCHNAVNITTWYGSERSFVENVVYRNMYIEDDSPEHSMQPMIQSSDDDKFVHRGNWRANTIHIAPERLGTSTGNQGIKPPESMEGYNICYRNIVFENVHCTDKEPVVKIGENNSYTNIYGITAQGCDFEI